MKRIFTTLSQKWPEYLLEAVVITAGVLGAFALNNWNENAKERKKEALLLTEINQEFMANQAQFQEVTEAHNQALQAINYFLDHYFKEPNQDSLETYFSRTKRHFTFNPSQSSIASLVANSSIDIISDEVLRKELVQWSDRVIDYQEEELKTKKFVEDVAIPWMIENVDLSSVKLDLSEADQTKFQNILIVRKNHLIEILSGNEHEGAILKNSMNLIIELSAPKDNNAK